jgi:hypothetical protein
VPTESERRVQGVDRAQFCPSKLHQLNCKSKYLLEMFMIADTAFISSLRFIREIGHEYVTWIEAAEDRVQ